MKNWPKIIAHVDMDAFFASIEQRDFPELKGRPVAVTNGLKGNCIITCSYEARQWGVKTGLRFREAKQLCPSLIQRSARPQQYAQISKAILDSLTQLTPDIEVFSVDEAFLEFTYCHALYQDIFELQQQIKETVLKASHLTCSVGMSHNKTVAKWGSHYQKPNGGLIIPPEKAKFMLSEVPVIELCGIGPGIRDFLESYGVFKCADITKIPISVLSKRFGSLGRRIWLMCQGEDPVSLYQTIDDPKTMGHGKILPPNTTDKATILFFLGHISDKLGQRLRKHQLEAQTFSIALRCKKNYLSVKVKTVFPTNDETIIYQLTQDFLDEYWKGEGVFQCQLTALDPLPEKLQPDLFEDNRSVKQDKVNSAVDSVNQKFGKKVLTRASRIKQLEVSDVISPAWRPFKHRDTLE